MYWSHPDTGNRIVKPTVCFHEIEQTPEYSLVLNTDDGEALPNVFLVCLDYEYAGYLEAKLDTDEDYKPITSYPIVQCGLGDITAASQTTVNFRLSYPSSADEGRRVIRLALIADDLVQPLDFFFEDDFDLIWKDIDDIAFWGNIG